MKHLFTILFLLVGWGWVQGLQAQALDPAFQPTTLKVPFSGGLQTGPQLTLVQPDSKVLVAGGFDFVNGTLASKITRLNADGTPDATFNPGGTGANGFIAAMALQPDGKIIIVGGFTTYNGVPQFAQARLNADGTHDASFAGRLAATIRQLAAVAVQSDGKVLVGSGPTTTSAMTQAVDRLNTDGTLDTSFTPPAAMSGDFVRAILVQADGKIVLGGSAASFPSTLSSGVVRLNTDGSADTSFSSGISANAAVGGVYALAQQPDAKLLVGGNIGLTTSGSAVSGGVARLLPSGALDNTFTNTFNASTSFNGLVRTLLLQPSGSIVVGGSFTRYNGTARGRVLRLSATGTLDPDFATSTGANSSVLSVAATASGQVVVAGVFTQYDGGSTRTGLTRLTTAGVEDAAFNAPILETRGNIATAALLASGQLLVQGTFTTFNGAVAPGSTASVRRINANGSLDAGYGTTATTLLGTQPDGTFYSISSTTSGTIQSTLLRILPTGTPDAAFANPAFAYVEGTKIDLYPLKGVIVQPDGKLLAYGTFTTFGGASRNSLVRLNANGTIDNTFVPPAGTQRQIYNVALQASGKMVLAYASIPSGPNSSNVNLLARLNTDGTPDNTFASGTGPNAADYISLLAQPDDKLLVSGLSSFSGQAVPYGTLRLTADGAVDNTFNQLSAVYIPILVQPDGRILASTYNDRTALTSYGASTLVRLNSTGSRDGTFGPISTPRSIFSGDNAFNGFLYQPADNKIITYGSFTSVLGQVRVGLARIMSGVVTATQTAIAAQPLIVYPNPARQQLTVVLPVLAQSTQATLRSLTGQVVRQWSLPAWQTEAVLSLDAVAAGLYVLRIASPAGLYQQKVVVVP